MQALTLDIHGYQTRLVRGYPLNPILLNLIITMFKSVFKKGRVYGSNKKKKEKCFSKNG